MRIYDTLWYTNTSEKGNSQIIEMLRGMTLMVPGGTQLQAPQKFTAGTSELAPPQWDSIVGNMWLYENSHRQTRKNTEMFSEVSSFHRNNGNTAVKKVGIVRSIGFHIMHKESCCKQAMLLLQEHVPPRQGLRWPQKNISIRCWWLSLWE